MERRKFIRQSCLLCAASLSGGVSFLLEACAPTKLIELTPESGSVRLPISSLDADAITVVRVQGEFYDVGVTGSPAKGYLAMVMRCTHAQNPVYPEGQAFQCPTHGSRFDAEGIVTRGPAQQRLRRLETRLEPGNLVIRLPRDDGTEPGAP